MADDGMFTVDEVKTLILALGRGQHSFSDEDIDLVVDWAREKRIGNALLELALKDRVDLSVIDGKVHIGAKNQKRSRAVKDFA